MSTAESSIQYRPIPPGITHIKDGSRYGSAMTQPAGLKLHSSGNYRAWINGRYKYFGKNLERAVQKYGLALAQVDDNSALLAEIIVEIQKWSDERYPQSGRWGGAAELFRYSLKFLNKTVRIKLPRGETVEVYLPTLPVESFSCVHLSAVRQSMIDSGSKRGYINSVIRRIQLGFAQMRPLGLVSAELVADLRTLQPLPMGFAKVKDNPPVGPVSDVVIDAVILCMKPQMSAVATTLRHTAKLRVGECVSMRIGGLDDSGEIWVYDLGFNHKGRNTGRRKLVPIGKRAQAAMKPYVDAAKAKMSTTAPIWPALNCRNQTDHVSVSSVRDSLELACDKAGRARFTTHRLRHSRATALARMEAEVLRRVQQSMGHDSESSTRIYAELDAIAIEHARLSG